MVVVCRLGRRSRVDLGKRMTPRQISSAGAAGSGGQWRHNNHHKQYMLAIAIGSSRYVYAIPFHWKSFTLYTFPKDMNFFREALLVLLLVEGLMGWRVLLSRHLKFA